MIGPVYFVNNKYRRWYFQIMGRALRRALPCNGHERHHVVPKALGGLDRVKVILTYREHFLAHWLLPKFTVGHTQLTMYRALGCMAMSRAGRIKAGWQYAIVRGACHIAHRGKRYALGCKRGPETRAKMRLAAQERFSRPEVRAKLSAAARNRSTETREKLRRAATNLGAETRAKRSAAARRRRHSEETKQKLRAITLGNKRCVGRTLSAETRRKIGIASRNRRPEVIEKIRAAALRREQIRRERRFANRGVLI